MADTRTKEQELQRTITRRVEEDLPGVEVLAVELSGVDRFTVFVDHPAGVDHALCGLVTDSLYALAAGTVAGLLRRKGNGVRYGSGIVFIALGATAALAKRT